MSAELSAALGFVTAGFATMLTTPLVIGVAHRIDLVDSPREYRKHAAPTALLGGASVLAGFLVGAIAIGGTTGHLVVLLGCAAGLWLVGTLDDRVEIAPSWRVLAEVGAALALVEAGIGWNTSAGAGVDLLLTVVWIVGLANAFNLMDNLDGACATVASVSAGGVGLLAVIHGQSTLAGLSFALAGACIAFLRWNLAGPAKVFLGDGGSLPIGFLVGALAMATSRHLNVGDASLLVGAFLAAIPILDTALVSVSRTRRGVTLLTGGRDHLTHRLLLALHAPWAVAATLAAAQAVLCAIAIWGDQLSAGGLGALALVAVLLGLLAIAVLDTARWRPSGIAVASRPHPQHPSPQPVGIDSP